MGRELQRDRKEEWSSDEVTSGGNIYRKSGGQKWTRLTISASRLLVLLLALLFVGSIVEAMSTSNSSSPGEQSGTSNYRRPGTRPNIGYAMVKKLKTQVAGNEPTQVGFAVCSQ
jgi:hypothetical protein